MSRRYELWSVKILVITFPISYLSACQDNCRSSREHSFSRHIRCRRREWYPATADRNRGVGISIRRHCAVSRLCLRAPRS